MEPDTAAPWSCPVCYLPLVVTDRTLRCQAGHSFDLSKDKYANLLPGRQPAHSGDSLHMLQARRRFLEAGHYQPLMLKLAELVTWYGTQTDTIDHQGPLTILDAGCGEGYYSGSLGFRLPLARILGTDVSREAIRLASRRYPRIGYAVADTNQRLPVPDASIQVVLNIFAPRNVTEFARILAPGGHLIVVIPSPQHLQRLRDHGLVLGIEADKAVGIQQQLTMLKLCHQEILSTTVNLTSAALADLLEMMPPLSHRATPLGFGTLPGQQVTAEFIVMVFQKPR